MGIHGLSKFLREKGCYKESNLQELKASGVHSVCIDYRLQLGQYKTATDHSYHDVEQLFTKLINLFKSMDIHLYMVDDGVSHVFKSNTKIKRIDLRNKTKINRYKSVSDDYQKLTGDTIEVTDTSGFKEFIDTKIEESINVEERETLTKLAMDHKKAVSYSKPVVFLVEEMIKLKEYIISLGIPFITANAEGEKCCSELVYHNWISAAISADSDCIPSLCPLTITKLTITTGVCTIIEIDDVLEKLELTPEQLVELCTMTRNDYYAVTIPKVAINTAYKLIKQYGSIESLMLNRKDLDYSNIQNYEEVRDLLAPGEFPSIKSIEMIEDN